MWETRAVVGGAVIEWLCKACKSQGRRERSREMSRGGLKKGDRGRTRKVCAAVLGTVRLWQAPEVDNWCKGQHEDEEELPERRKPLLPVQFCLAGLPSWTRVASGGEGEVGNTAPISEITGARRDPMGR